MYLIKECPCPKQPGKGKETHESHSAVAVVTPENKANDF